MTYTGFRVGNQPKQGSYSSSIRWLTGRYEARYDPDNPSFPAVLPGPWPFTSRPDSPARKPAPEQPRFGRSQPATLLPGEPRCRSRLDAPRPAPLTSEHQAGSPKDLA